MTKREMLEKVAAGEMNEDIMAKAAELVEAMDAEAVKRKEKADEKRAEKLEAEASLVDAIVEFLGDEFVTATDIFEGVEGISSAQKATILAKRGVEQGRIVTDKVKGKSGKVNGYKRA